jgi:uncharacterized repeat protein (TIGR01451 family)
MKHIPKCTVIAALVSVLLVTGCQQTSMQTSQRRPRAAATPEPLPPAPAPKTPPPAARQDCTTPTAGLIKLSKTMPKEAVLGQTFEYQLQLTAADCVDNIVVTDQVPDGATYVRSEPAAQVDGKRLAWRLTPMEEGQSGTLRVWLKADKEGTLAACATVSADPRVCASTLVGKPALSIEKSGPETAVLGSTVNYTILVANRGSAIARGVVITDVVPTGLESANGQKSLTYEVGDLGPNQSKSVTVPLRAATRGRHCNIAVATSSNAGSVTNDACTTVLQPGLKIVKTGDKERFLGRNASYQIGITNTGDTTLTDVVVTDTAPNATTIVSASGASVSGNQAVWRLASLPAHSGQTFEVVLTSKTPGTHCNGATVVAAGGLRDSAEACTLWRGIAAVLLEVVDDPDPITADEQNTYTIRVTNQGTADLTTINVAALFDDEMSPVSSAEGRVAGQNVTFPPVARLAPKQSFTYTIRVKGVKAGDARNKITITADGLTAPIVEEESTRVY